MFEQLDNLYELNISKMIGKEYSLFVNDLVRILVIHTIYDLMVFLNNPGTHSLFNASFFEHILFMTLGILTYWLIVRKIIYVS
jgi:hypothetical protein